MTIRPPSSIRSVPPMRAIVVDERELVRAKIRSVLDQSKTVELVAEFATGAASLEQLDVLQPDVAIVNMDLPDLDGIELTQQAKSRYSHLKVLLLTGNDREESVLEAFSAGAEGYCLEEFMADNLVLALAQLQAGHAWIDPAIAHIVLERIRVEVERPDTISISAADTELSEHLEDSPLTERELEVLEKIVDGYSNAAIAEEFHIGMGTVKTHVRNLLQKLNATDRTQAAVRALRTGLVK